MVVLLGGQLRSTGAPPPGRAPSAPDPHPVAPAPARAKQVPARDRPARSQLVCAGVCGSVEDTLASRAESDRRYRCRGPVEFCGARAPDNAPRPDAGSSPQTPQEAILGSGPWAILKRCTRVRFANPDSATRTLVLRARGKPMSGTMVRGASSNKCDGARNGKRKWSSPSRVRGTAPRRLSAVTAGPFSDETMARERSMPSATARVESSARSEAAPPWRCQSSMTRAADPPHASTRIEADPDRGGRGAPRRPAIRHESITPGLGGDGAEAAPLRPTCFSATTRFATLSLHCRSPASREPPLFRSAAPIWCGPPCSRSR
jgi:hypothetical protein